MDLSKLSTADKILLGAGLLFFIVTFLPWQSACPDFGFEVAGVKCDFSAWGGSGGFLGVLAALLSLALVVWIGMQVAGVNLNLNIPSATVAAALAGGTVLFGLIKFLVAVTNSPAWGAFVGLVLLLAIAYGGYMKWQESKLALPPTATQPPPGPPPVG
nr:hypothetical protein [Actinomycetota bacterium]